MQNKIKISTVNEYPREEQDNRKAFLKKIIKRKQEKLELLRQGCSAQDLVDKGFNGISIKEII
ncbi:MAG: hypothetical protein ACEPOV_06260 [Hyphomicrobiales bacterium]